MMLRADAMATQARAPPRFAMCLTRYLQSRERDYFSPVCARLVLFFFGVVAPSRKCLLMGIVFMAMILA